MRIFFVLIVLFFFVFYVKGERVSQTRCLAVRFNQSEDVKRFRIDVLELIDENPRNENVEGALPCFNIRGENQFLSQMLVCSAKRKGESAGNESLRGGPLLGGDLFPLDENEGIVRFCRKDISWHRYSFYASIGSFDVKLDTTNTIIRVFGTVTLKANESPKLSSLSFYKKDKDIMNKQSSFSFDMKNDIEENRNYLIVWEATVW